MEDERTWYHKVGVEWEEGSCYGFLVFLCLTGGIVIWFASVLDFCEAPAYSTGVVGIDI